MQFIAYPPENGKLHSITGARVAFEDFARTGPHNGYFIVGDTMEIPTSPTEAFTGVRLVHSGSRHEAMLQDTLVLEATSGPRALSCATTTTCPGRAPSAGGDKFRASVSAP